MMKWQWRMMNLKKEKEDRKDGVHHTRHPTPPSRVRKKGKKDRKGGVHLPPSPPLLEVLEKEEKKEKSVVDIY